VIWFSHRLRETGAEAVCAALQAVQHTWTYKPLVQDVLGMSLNRVTLDAEPSTSQQILQQTASSKNTYEVRGAVWQSAYDVLLLAISRS